MKRTRTLLISGAAMAALLGASLATLTGCGGDTGPEPALKRQIRALEYHAPAAQKRKHAFGECDARDLPNFTCDD